MFLGRGGRRRRGYDGGKGLGGILRAMLYEYRSVTYVVFIDVVSVY